MKKNINRAGVYISQPGGYRSFSPKPLPPEPPIETDNLQLLLSAADVALGRLDGVIHTLPSVDMFVAMYVRKEAVLSSQIEGTQSSLQDVLSAEAKIQDPKRPPDSGDVLNYIAAMDYGLARLQTLPLSTRLIREIHAKLMQNTRGGNLTPGELRKTQNWIGPAGCALQDATFVPPPAQEIAQYLAALEKFAHGDSPLPPLLKIGLLHAQFETIHPFLDGNGRLGRLLITFLLCEKKILSKPVLYL
ncbi:MAG: Fic family protein, partial [Gammaproteobacteria bacterium]